MLDFSCVGGCSKCCVEREYYPKMEFGKVGVLILPEETDGVKLLAEKHHIKITILPRIGTSYKKSGEPDQTLAYQLMGIEPNGNTCPFLDTESKERSPHGGYRCKIYEDRPLACRAYPVIESSPVTLDTKCKFCETCSIPSGNINSELESLLEIKVKMKTNVPYIWRYATGIGDKENKDQIKTGWFLV